MTQGHKHEAFDVTDDHLDAPDGAEVEIEGRDYRRVGMQWVPIPVPKGCDLCGRAVCAGGCYAP